MRKNLEGAPRRTPSSKDWTYRRGDIYMANLNPFKGSEQGGIRPVLVLQNDAGNFYFPTLILFCLWRQGIFSMEKGKIFPSSVFKSSSFDDKMKEILMRNHAVLGYIEITGQI